jgi:hypothetical protein
MILFAAQGLLLMGRVKLGNFFMSIKSYCQTGGGARRDINKQTGGHIMLWEGFYTV